ncbi:hypothetical protein BT63DRAFT_443657 [Microthyrium microscopicum]|uniref:Involucrin repeat protein n=1 Tax=Microthyrium microscopicum TaxID=703497 RepID=A0A6A6U021_9PEZI|nr:hypothetical protein BT63DRAFT_443657 [Microthyrium microscopicum]
MWNKITGRDSDTASIRSGSSRRKGEMSRRRTSEAGDSSRRRRDRDKERDLEDTIEVEEDDASRRGAVRTYSYPVDDTASVASSYATARSRRDGRERREERETPSRRATNDDYYHESPRRRERTEGSERDSARKNRDSESETGRRRRRDDESQRGTPTRGPERTRTNSSRAGDDLPGSQTGTPVTSTPLMSGALPRPPRTTNDSYGMSQFPGQVPEDYSAPYRPPIATTDSGHGAAADYYGDQGQSVHEQPGVRPDAPLINSQPHLMAPSTEAAPPEETGHGSAEAYFAHLSGLSDNDQAVQAGQSSSATPGKPSKVKPGKKPSRTSSGILGAAAATTGAALGYIGSHHQAGQSQSASQSLSTSTSYHSQSNTQGNSSLGIEATHSQISPRVSPSSSPYPGKPGRPKPGKHSSSHLGGIALGAAGLAAGAYGLHEFAENHKHRPSFHTQGSSHQQNSYSQENAQYYQQNNGYSAQGGYYGGDMDMERRNPNSGPIEKIVDWWKDHEDVRKMEAYTEAIGVCAHCFDPNDDPRDAPRKHHYHSRRNNRSQESLRKAASRQSGRVDKERRYFASSNVNVSDDERKKSSKAGLVAAGIAGLGFAKAASAIHRRDTEDDMVSATSRRTRKTRRRRSRSGDRYSSTSRGVIHDDDASEMVSVVAGEDGGYRYERRRRKRRSGSSSSGASSGRDHKMSGALAAGALGAAASSAVSIRSRRDGSSSPKKEFVRRHRRGESGSREELTIYRQGSNASRGSFESGRSTRSRAGGAASAGVLGGFLGSAFGRRGSKRSRKSGFFSFGNNSSSSHEGLTYGYDPKHERRRARAEKKERRETEHIQSKIAALGATAAALGAVEGGRKFLSKHGHSSSSEFLSGRHHRDDRGRIVSRPSRPIAGATEGAHDGWEDVSEDEDARPPTRVSTKSSYDEDLAFGDFQYKGKGRKSTDSLASSNSGTWKWPGSWRWGTKKRKSTDSLHATSDVHGFAPSTVAAIAGAAAAGGVAGALANVHPVQTGSHAFDAIRHDDAPLYTSRPGESTSIVAPQPYVPVTSAMYSAPPPAYVAPSGPPVDFTRRQNSNDAYYFENDSSSRRDRRQSERPDPKRRNSSPPQSHLGRDAAIAGIAAVAATSAIAAATSSGRDAGRRQSGGVRFDTRERDDYRREKEERKRRDDDGVSERKETEARAIAAEAARREEMARAERRRLEDAAREETDRAERRRREAEAEAAREEAARLARRRREADAEAARIENDRSERRRAEEERMESERRRREEERFEVERSERRRREEEERAEAERSERRRREEEERVRAEKEREVVPDKRRDREQKKRERREARAGRSDDKRSDRQSDAGSTISSVVGAAAAGAAATAVVGSLMGKEKKRDRDVSTDGRHRSHSHSRSEHREASPPSPPKAHSKPTSTVSNSRDVASSTHTPGAIAFVEAKPSGVEIDSFDQDFDPDYFRKRMARKAAAKVAHTPAPTSYDEMRDELNKRYEHPEGNYATFFTPQEVKDHSHDRAVPSANGDADIAVFHAPDMVPSGVGMPPYDRAYNFKTRDDEGASLGAWPVPSLNLIEPTPPGTRVGTPAPLAREERAVDDVESVGRKSSDRKSSRDVEDVEPVRRKSSDRKSSDRKSSHGKEVAAGVAAAAVAAGAVAAATHKSHEREEEEDYRPTSRSKERHVEEPSRSMSKVRWGEDEVRHYEVLTPEQHAARDGYIGAHDIGPQAHDEIVVEEGGPDGYRVTKYKPEDEEKSDRSRDNQRGYDRKPEETIHRSTSPQRAHRVIEPDNLQDPSFYQTPYFETVSDLGSTTGGANIVMPTHPGIVEGEVFEETPPINTDRHRMPGGFDNDDEDITPKASRRNTRDASTRDFMRAEQRAEPGQAGPGMINVFDFQDHSVSPAAIPLPEGSWHESSSNGDYFSQHSGHGLTEEPRELDEATLRAAGSDIASQRTIEDELEHADMASSVYTDVTNRTSKSEGADPLIERRKPNSSSRRVRENDDVRSEQGYRTKRRESTKDVVDMSSPLRRDQARREEEDDVKSEKSSRSKRRESTKEEVASPVRSERGSDKSSRSKKRDIVAEAAAIVSPRREEDVRSEKSSRSKRREEEEARSEKSSKPKTRDIVPEAAAIIPSQREEDSRSDKSSRSKHRDSMQEPVTVVPRREEDDARSEKSSRSKRAESIRDEVTAPPRSSRESLDIRSSEKRERSRSRQRDETTPFLSSRDQLAVAEPEKERSRSRHRESKDEADVPPRSSRDSLDVRSSEKREHSRSRSKHREEAAVAAGLGALAVAGAEKRERSRSRQRDPDEETKHHRSHRDATREDEEPKHHHRSHRESLDVTGSEKRERSRSRQRSTAEEEPERHHRSHRESTREEDEPKKHHRSHRESLDVTGSEKRERSRSRQRDSTREESTIVPLTRDALEVRSDKRERSHSKHREVGDDDTRSVRSHRSTREDDDDTRSEHRHRHRSHRETEDDDDTKSVRSERKHRSRRERDDDDTASVASSERKHRSRRERDDDDNASVISSATSRRDKDKKESSGGLLSRILSKAGSTSDLSKTSSRDDEDDRERRKRRKDREREKERDLSRVREDDDDDTRSVRSSKRESKSDKGERREKRKSKDAESFLADRAEGDYEMHTDATSEPLSANTLVLSGVAAAGVAGATAAYLASQKSDAEDVEEKRSRHLSRVREARSREPSRDREELDQPSRNRELAMEEPRHHSLELPQLPESRPTTPIAVGSWKDLPSLPSSRPQSHYGFDDDEEAPASSSPYQSAISQPNSSPLQERRELQDLPTQINTPTYGGSTLILPGSPTTPTKASSDMDAFGDIPTMASPVASLPLDAVSAAHLPSLPSSRPTSPINIGSHDDLPKLPSTRSGSPIDVHSIMHSPNPPEARPGSPNDEEPSTPLRPTLESQRSISTTAVPFRFRTPQSSPLKPPAEDPLAGISLNRPRHGRAGSADVRLSGRAPKPLQLVESTREVSPMAIYARRNSMGSAAAHDQSLTPTSLRQFRFPTPQFRHSRTISRDTIPTGDELRPMLLAERHGQRPVDDDLPELPPSRDESRVSSMGSQEIETKLLDDEDLQVSPPTSPVLEGDVEALPTLPPTRPDSPYELEPQHEQSFPAEPARHAKHDERESSAERGSVDIKDAAIAAGVGGAAILAAHKLLGKSDESKESADIEEEQATGRDVPAEVGAAEKSVDVSSLLQRTPSKGGKKAKKGKKGKKMEQSWEPEPAQPELEDQDTFEAAQSGDDSVMLRDIPAPIVEATADEVSPLLQPTNSKGGKKGKKGKKSKQAEESWELEPIQPDEVEEVQDTPALEEDISLAAPEEALATSREISDPVDDQSAEISPLLQRSNSKSGKKAKKGKKGKKIEDEWEPEPEAVVATPGVEEAKELSASPPVEEPEEQPSMLLAEPETAPEQQEEDVSPLLQRSNSKSGKKAKKGKKGKKVEDDWEPEPETIEPTLDVEEPTEFSTSLPVEEPEEQPFISPAEPEIAPEQPEEDFSPLLQRTSSKGGKKAKKGKKGKRAQEEDWEPEAAEAPVEQVQTRDIVEDDTGSALEISEKIVEAETATGREATPVVDDVAQIDREEPDIGTDNPLLERSSSKSGKKAKKEKKGKKKGKKGDDWEPEPEPEPIEPSPLDQPDSRDISENQEFSQSQEPEVVLEPISLATEELEARDLTSDEPLPSISQDLPTDALEASTRAGIEEPSALHDKSEQILESEDNGIQRHAVDITPLASEQVQESPLLQRTDSKAGKKAKKGKKSKQLFDDWEPAAVETASQDEPADTCDLVPTEDTDRNLEDVDAANIVAPDEHQPESKDISDSSLLQGKKGKKGKKKGKKFSEEDWEPEAAEAATVNEATAVDDDLSTDQPTIVREVSTVEEPTPVDEPLSCDVAAEGDLGSPADVPEMPFVEPTVQPHHTEPTPAEPEVAGVHRTAKEVPAEEPEISKAIADVEEPTPQEPEEWLEQPKAKLKKGKKGRKKTLDYWEAEPVESSAPAELDQPLDVPTENLVDEEQPVALKDIIGTSASDLEETEKPTKLEPQASDSTSAMPDDEEPPVYLDDLIATPTTERKPNDKPAETEVVDSIIDDASVLPVTFKALDIPSTDPVLTMPDDISHPPTKHVLEAHRQGDEASPVVMESHIEPAFEPQVHKESEATRKTSSRDTKLEEPSDKPLSVPSDPVDDSVEKAEATFTDEPESVSERARSPEPSFPLLKRALSKGKKGKKKKRVTWSDPPTPAEPEEPNATQTRDLEAEPEIAQSAEQDDWAETPKPKGNKSKKKKAQASSWNEDSEATPAADQDNSLVEQPVIEPVVEPIVEPSVEPIKDSPQRPIAEPVKEPIAEPAEDFVVKDTSETADTTELADNNELAEKPELTALTEDDSWVEKPKAKGKKGKKKKGQAFKWEDEESGTISPPVEQPIASDTAQELPINPAPTTEQDVSEPVEDSSWAGQPNPKGKKGKKNKTQPFAWEDEVTTAPTEQEPAETPRELPIDSTPVVEQSVPSVLEEESLLEQPKPKGKKGKKKKGQAFNWEDEEPVTTSSEQPSITETSREATADPAPVLGEGNFAPASEETWSEMPKGKGKKGKKSRQAFNWEEPDTSTSTPAADTEAVQEPAEPLPTDIAAPVTEDTVNQYLDIQEEQIPQPTAELTAHQIPEPPAEPDTSVRSAPIEDDDLWAAPKSKGKEGKKNRQQTLDWEETEPVTTEETGTAVASDVPLATEEFAEISAPKSKTKGKKGKKKNQAQDWYEEDPPLSATENEVIEPKDLNTERVELPVTVADVEPDLERSRETSMDDTKSQPPLFIDNEAVPEVEQALIERPSTEHSEPPIITEEPEPEFSINSKKGKKKKNKLVDWTEEEPQSDAQDVAATRDLDIEDPALASTEQEFSPPAKSKKKGKKKNLFTTWDEDESPAPVTEAEDITETANIDTSTAPAPAKEDEFEQSSKSKKKNKKKNRSLAWQEEDAPALDVEDPTLDSTPIESQDQTIAEVQEPEPVVDESVSKKKGKKNKKKSQPFSLDDEDTGTATPTAAEDSETREVVPNEVEDEWAPTTKKAKGKKGKKGKKMEAFSWDEPAEPSLPKSDLAVEEMIDREVEMQQEPVQEPEPAPVAPLTETMDVDEPETELANVPRDLNVDPMDISEPIQEERLAEEESTVQPSKKDKQKSKKANKTAQALEILSAAGTAAIAAHMMKAGSEESSEHTSAPIQLDKLEREHPVLSREMEFDPSEVALPEADEHEHESLERHISHDPSTIPLPIADEMEEVHLAQTHHDLAEQRHTAKHDLDAAVAIADVLSDKAFSRPSSRAGVLEEPDFDDFPQHASRKSSRRGSRRQSRAQSRERAMDLDEPQPVSMAEDEFAAAVSTGLLGAGFEGGHNLEKSREIADDRLQEEGESPMEITGMRAGTKTGWGGDRSSSEERGSKRSKPKRGRSLEVEEPVEQTVEASQEKEMEPVDEWALPVEKKRGKKKGKGGKKNKLRGLEEEDTPSSGMDIDVPREREENTYHSELVGAALAGGIGLGGAAAIAAHGKDKEHDQASHHEHKPKQSPDSLHQESHKRASPDEFDETVLAPAKRVETDEVAPEHPDTLQLEDGHDVKKRLSTREISEPSWSFPQNRDSAIEVIDTPVLTQEPSPRNTTRDSGFPETPIIAHETPEPHPRDFEPVSTSKRSRSSRRSSIKSPTKIQVEVPADWDVAVGEGSPEKLVFQEKGTPPKSEHVRSPPAVESTSRERSSAVLFQSSPSTREHSQLEHSTPQRHPIEPTTPKVAEESPARLRDLDLESPLLKKTHDLEDLGDSPRSHKAAKVISPKEHASTHRAVSGHASDGLRINTGSGPRAISPSQASHVSIDDMIARRSWPPVDEDNETVGIDNVLSRDKQRTVSTPSRKPSHSHELRHMGHSGNLRSASIASDVSASGIGRLRSPDFSRPLSAASNGSSRSLRRTDRGSVRDLRSQNHSPTPSSGASALATTIAGTALLSSLASNSTRANSKGKARDMDGEYDGIGTLPQSPRSPARPHSLRKRQSLHVMDLEGRVEQLSAETRQHQEAVARAERAAQDAIAERETHLTSVRNATEALTQRDVNIREKDEQIRELRDSIQNLQNEVDRLAQENGTLTEQNQGMANNATERVVNLESEHENTHKQWQDALLTIAALKAQQADMTKKMDDMVRDEISKATADQEREIHRLQTELDDSVVQIRELQQQVLDSKQAGDDFLIVRDEDYFEGACQQLCTHVQQWVLRFSKFSDTKASRLSSDVKDKRTEERLDDCILDGSDVDGLLNDRIKRRDVFMSITMSLIWEYVFTRYLFGLDQDQRKKLKSLEKQLTEIGPRRAVAQWRAITLTLLSRRESFKAQRKQDTEAVVQEIVATLSRLLPPPSHLKNQVLESLRKVMGLAVNLSIEMRTQRPEFIMLPPLRPEYDANGDLAGKVNFSAALMNDRSPDELNGEKLSNEDLEAQEANVKIVLFPLVVKKGDDSGEGEDEIVVCPAQVLVAKQNKGKKVVRVLSGAMDIDPRRSSAAIPGEGVPF